MQAQHRKAEPLAHASGIDEATEAAAIGDQGVAHEVDDLGHRLDAERAEEIIYRLERLVAHVLEVEDTAEQRVDAMPRSDPAHMLSGWPERVLALEFARGIGHGRKRPVHQLVREPGLALGAKLIVVVCKKMLDIAHEISARDVARSQSQ